ncbi:MAG TPA: hypothetical protein VMV32_07270 [Ignavibacteriaceae bacterium]|nr:hypothetical protein [Ignavibacteriaceae bacterium]
MDNRQYLDLKIIWKDDDMFEIKVSASNGRFSGITEVYDTPDSLLSFAKSLKGFPIGNKIIFYEAGKKDGYAYFSMRFYAIDNFGHVGIQICLEENVSTEFRAEEKDKISLELLVEPSAIDSFQNELIHLAEKQEGNATIYGNIMKTK